MRRGCRPAARRRGWELVVAAAVAVTLAPAVTATATPAMPGVAVAEAPATPAAAAAPALPDPTASVAAPVPTIPPAPVAAPAGVPQSGTITRLSLPQAIELAQRRNPGLRVQAAVVESTRAGEVTAGLRPNPTFTNGTVDLTGGLGWTIERGGKRRRRIDSARLATAGAEHDLGDTRRTLIGTVRTTFAAALLARGNRLAAEENLKNFQQVEDVNRIRRDKGDISGGDFLKIGLQMLQFQTDLQDADLAYRTAKANLRQAIYAPELASDFDVEGELSPAPLPLALDDLERRALAARPDLLSAETAVRKAEADLELAKANAKVDVTVSVGWIHTGPSVAGDDRVEPFFTAGQTANALGTGLSFPLPIFDRNQGEIARTRSEVTRSRAAADVVRAQVIDDVEVAHAALEASRARIDLYERVYLEKSRDSRNVAEFAYRKGASSILDLLDAERTDRATRLAYRQALADYATHLAQLEAAVGEALSR